MAEDNSSYMQHQFPVPPQSWTNWFASRTKPVQRLIDGTVAALVFAIWIAVWFSSGDPMIIWPALLAAEVLGSLAIAMVAGTDKFKTASWLVFTATNIAIGAFVYFHNHPSHEVHLRSVSRATVPKTIPPVAVNASPPKARVIPKPEEPIHYDVIGFYSLFHGMTEIQRDKLLELYRGRWLRVSGATIADIADMGDTFMVTLTVPWGQYLQPFTCTSDKETDKQVGLLAKGSVVELTGQISGVVDLNHCKFDSIKPPSASPQ